MKHDPKMLKACLKVLLYDLAKKSEHPAEDLNRLITDVINELYWDAKKTIEEKKSHLRLIVWGAKQ